MYTLEYAKISGNDFDQFVVTEVAFAAVEEAKVKACECLHGFSWPELYTGVVLLSFLAPLRGSETRLAA